MQLSKVQSVKAQQKECQPAPSRMEIWHFGKVQGFEVEMIASTSRLPLLFLQEFCHHCALSKMILDSLV